MHLEFHASRRRYTLEVGLRILTSRQGLFFLDTLFLSWCLTSMPTQRHAPRPSSLGSLTYTSYFSALLCMLAVATRWDPVESLFILLYINPNNKPKMFLLFSLALVPRAFQCCMTGHDHDWLRDICVSKWKCDRPTFLLTTYGTGRGGK